MQVQINSDNSIAMQNSLSDSIGSYINNVLNVSNPTSRFASTCTFTGENHRTPDRGPIEKRCLLEVRPKHRGSLVASSEATDIDTAFAVAAQKMHRLLNNTFGRLSDKRRRANKMDLRLDRPRPVAATQ